MVGAVIGGVAGYLFFTDRGRELRRQTRDRRSTTLARELSSFRGTVNAGCRRRERRLEAAERGARRERSAAAIRQPASDQSPF